MRSLLCFFIIATSSMLASAGYLDTVYEWTVIDYLWPSEARKQEAIQNGEYDYSRILPMDVDKSQDGRVFVNFLGIEGVPATLGVVSDQRGNTGPLIIPYPDWSWFRKGDCDSITNVYRIAIDECNRLWVLDTGFVEGKTMNCPAQLLAFDLHTDRLIKRVKIPNEISRNREGATLLANPIVETSGQNCENTTVFMADTFGNGLVIYNGERLFRLENRLFRPNEAARIFNVGNVTADLNGGIVGMDISPSIFPGESRFLYFHALASFDLYSVETNVLKRSISGESIRFQGAQNILSSQAIGQAFSSQGTLFLGMSREIAIACWNRYRPMTRENFEIVAQDSERLQYVNGMKVIPPARHGEVEELWALSNRFISFQLGQLSAEEVNFRIMKSPVERLISGTKCDIPPDTLISLQAIHNHGGDSLIVSD